MLHGLAHVDTLKIPLLFLACVAGQICFTPPNPPPKKEEQAKYDGGTELLTRISGWLPTWMIGIIWSIEMCEVATLLALCYPSATSSKFLSVLCMHTSDPYNIRTTTVFLVGWVLMVIGAYIRLACYRELGRQFTFQLSVREGHKLITSGPYSYVRHPSYTGGFIFTFGMLLVELGSGSWLKESGIMNTPGGKVFTYAWIAMHSLLCVMFMHRTIKEDATLRREFDKQWHEWSERTPYKLIPGVY